MTARYSAELTLSRNEKSAAREESSTHIYLSTDQTTACLIICQATCSSMRQSYNSATDPVPRTLSSRNTSSGSANSLHRILLLLLQANTKQRSREQVFCVCCTLLRYCASVGVRCLWGTRVSSVYQLNQFRKTNTTTPLHFYEGFANN